MTPPLEHDYIGLAAVEPKSTDVEQVEEEMSVGSLRETELRLGPPGSPERKVELTLGLPAPSKGGGGVAVGSLGSKRGFSDAIIDGNGDKCWGLVVGREDEEKGGALVGNKDGKKVGCAPPAAKAQVVGWPPIRNYRKNTMAANPSSKNGDDVEEKQGSGCLYVKVSMDGAPYLRKVDLRMYCNYKELSSALEKMFCCFTIGSHEVPNKEGLSENRLNDLHGSEYVLTYEDKDGDWMLVGDVPWDMFSETCKRLRIMKGSEAIGLAPRAAEKRKG